ncbi:MAG: DUF58 domain-containing protein [Oscillospiraceae bacterium]|nr:DUF58 domain-containing protein [Oscillospiraceae bacterium]
MKYLYFPMLFFSVCFFVMYKGDLSFILLVFMAVLPIVTFILLCITSLFVRVNAHFEQMTTSRESSAVLKVTIQNRSLIPITSCIVEVMYTPSVLFDAPVKRKFKFSAAVGAKTTENFAVNITPAHCGTIDVKVSKIRIRDILGLCSIPVKAGFGEKILSLPVIFPVQASVENNPVFSAESNTFSQVKAGDDPSEIFALREYREGDSNNRIHWKLSSRSDTFIVKELSLPVGCNTLIAADFYGCKNASEADRILDAVFSVSNFLAEYGTAHSIAYADTSFGIKKYKISNSDEFYVAESALCSSIKEIASGIPFVQAAASDNSFAVKGTFSRVIAIADYVDAVRAEMLEDFCGDARLTIICTGNLDTTQDYDDNRVEIIYADAETLSNRELLII